MKLTLAEPRFLKDSISIISDLVNEVTFKIDKERIELIAMDPANVAMIIFNLLSSSFVEYNVEKKEEISVSLASLNQVLKRVKPSDTLTLELKDNRLKITLKGESTRTFNLALINLAEGEQKTPELKFNAKVTTPTYILNEAIEDMSIVAESVAFTASQGFFLIESESNLNTANVNITTDEETSINLNSNSNIKSKYSIEYLKKIIKGSKLTDTVQLQFGNDYPLRVDFKVLDKLQLSFILAPRVSND